MRKSIWWFAVILWLGTVLLAGCGTTSNKEATYNQDSWKELISDDCQHFFDWCNSCSKAEDWETLCTKMFCEVYEEPKCTDDEFVSENMDEASDEEINTDEESSEEAESLEIETNIDEAVPVAKLRISDDLTQEEIENQINETCTNMWWTWEDWSCVLEDWETVQF